MSEATAGQPAEAVATGTGPAPEERSAANEEGTTRADRPAAGTRPPQEDASPQNGEKNAPNGARRRRRGSRGGRGRGRSSGGSRPGGEEGDGVKAGTPPSGGAPAEGENGARPKIGDSRPAGAGPKPKIGDSRPAPAPSGPSGGAPTKGEPSRRGGGNRSGSGRGGRRGAKKPEPAPTPVEAVLPTTEETESEAADERKPSRRRGGRERRGKAVGRYMICVHVQPHMTQIALLEGRSLVEHYVSRASDDTTQIDGNIYRGRVQNVLPGMEAAFIDISTPKNAVLYRGDVRYDKDDVESGSSAQPRIEQVLKPGQTILCQVTKNPIGAKGARLTQEVSLPGRFVVLVPESSTYGISKRLEDAERKRLRKIVDSVKPKGHGIIVRTAAAGASAEELRNDIGRLVQQWEAISAEAAKGSSPALLYREPDMAVRVIREELNREYRSVLIDDPALYEQVRDYVAAVNPELADRVEFYDPSEEPLPLFDRYHVHEQLHKALDRKVYLPSGGSLVIDRTEALTVIDVNTGKNVGTTNLEETVYRNNLEAAEEVARQLRLRDIGGIIVIDFIDMEIRENRDKVGSALRAALARDKTRTQVFDISELGLVEMTRKRVSEGLIESLSTTCEVCAGRGIVFDDTGL